MSRATNLKNLLDSIANIEPSAFVRESGLGPFSFSQLRGDFETLQNYCRDFSYRKLEALPPKAISEIEKTGIELYNVIMEIMQFNFSSDNPMRIREVFSERFQENAANFYRTSSGWHYILTSTSAEKSEISDNLHKTNKEIESLIELANNQIDASVSDMHRKMAEFDETLAAAREASGATASSLFSSHFSQESISTKSSANKWLIATSLFGVATIALLVYFWSAAWNQNVNSITAVQLVTTKVICLGMAVAATLWCGKIYKALMHQSTVNRHRALSLETLSAFVYAAKDPAIRDSIVHEGAKSVFSSGSTGYIDGTSGESSDFKVLEIVKSVIPGGSQ